MCLRAYYVVAEGILVHSEGILAQKVPNSTPVPNKRGHVWWRFDLRAKFNYSSVRAPR